MQNVYNGFYHTPALWVKQQFGLVQFDFPPVLLEPKLPLLPNNLRLGHQMEYVFAHLINLSLRYKVIQRNILIEQNKIRLGELDFLLQDVELNRVIHVELAYKFYLINPNITEPIYRLVGPNKRDMFFTKVDKLKEKQLPLLRHSSLEPLWHKLALSVTNISQQCCFKAQLFKPYQNTSSIRPLNKNCIVGSWLSFDHFNTTAFAKGKYYIPKKLHWVISPHAQVPWQNHFNTLLELNLRMVKESSPLIWHKGPNGVIEKLFIVWW